MAVLFTELPFPAMSSPFFRVGLRRGPLHRHHQIRLGSGAARHEGALRLAHLRLTNGVSNGSHWRFFGTCPPSR